MTALAPLSDVTVIEIDNWMAAPSAGAILADLGATVIKVEPLKGDPMRNMGRPPKLEGAQKSFDFTFDVDNRGKRSIAVALDHPGGPAIVHRLVKNAAIFMCNLLPQRQQKFALDAKSLLAINPKLVHATLTGYGSSGPDALRPGYDVTAFFGRSGLYDAQREGVAGAVPMARPAQGDHTTGLAFVGAILAALRLAERSGVGQAVETSLFETAVWTQATDYAVTAVDRAPVRQRARHEMIIPTANRYPCGDGKWIVLNMPEPSAWITLCKVIGRDEWLTDPRLQDNRGRFTHMKEIVDGIDASLAKRSRDEWGKIFDSHDMIWGPVLSLDEVARDGQAEAIGLFPTISRGGAGDYRTVRIPMRFHNAEVKPRGSAPAVGQHTVDILQSNGLTFDEIDVLRRDGVIGGDFG